MLQRSAMRHIERELKRALADVALRDGARLVEIKRTGGGHYSGLFDNGRIVFTSSTPSDWRAIRNLKAQAKRALR